MNNFHYTIIPTFNTYYIITMTTNTLLVTSYSESFFFGHKSKTKTITYQLDYSANLKP